VDKPAREDWDHLDHLGESADAYAAFRAFLGLPPPRRLEHVLAWYPALELSTIRHWSATFFWRDRALAYEKARQAELADEVDRQWGEEKKEIAARHVAVTRIGLELAHRELLKWLARSDASTLPVGRSMNEVIRLMKESIVNERLVRGDTTERVAVGEIDLSKLTDEQFEVYEKLIALAARGGSSDAER
jgi:hypothetical protein